MVPFNNTLFISLIVLMIASVFVAADSAPIDHIERILPSTTPYRVAILHPLDPFSSCWSFYCNRQGNGVQNGEVVNAGSDILIVAAENQFLVGIQGGELGQLVDLGTEDALHTQYGCSNCFTGIQFSKEGVLSIPTDKRGVLKPLDLSGMKKNKAPISLGHIYLARIYNLFHNNNDTQLVVKFVVTSIVVDSTNTIETVTMRHQPMYVEINPNAGRSDCSLETDEVLVQTEIAISLSVIALVATIFVGVGNVAFLIYYCAFSKVQRGGVYGSLQKN